MTWDPNRKVQTNWQGGPITPSEVLYEVDGPTIFTSRVGLSNFLFFKHDETDDSEIFIAAAVSDADIAALRDGRISVRGALSYRDAWLIKADHEYAVERFQPHDFTSIEPFLPPRGIGLSPSFGTVPDSLEQAEALLSFKFIGRSMTEDSIPLSVLKELVDGVYSFVRQTLLPKDLQKGRNNRFFDVKVGPPRLASLLVSIKGFDFDAVGMRNFRNTKHLEPELLRQEALELGGNLWRSISETSSLANQGELELPTAQRHSAFLNHIAQIVPSSDNDLERLEISYHGTDRPQIITIDQASGDRLIHAGQLEGIQEKSLRGSIVEVNGEARTFIVKSAMGRQTTVAPKWRVFEELERNDVLRRGVAMEITGRHWLRKRRDYMVTDEYPRILDPKAMKLL